MRSTFLILILALFLTGCTSEKENYADYIDEVKLEFEPASSTLYCYNACNSCKFSFNVKNIGTTSIHHFYVEDWDDKHQLDFSVSDGRGGGPFLSLAPGETQTLTALLSANNCPHNNETREYQTTVPLQIYSKNGEWIGTAPTGPLLKVILKN
jgi:hypothetical protein